MLIEAPLAPQIEQFIHDNPQGVLSTTAMAAWVAPLRRTG